MSGGESVDRLRQAAAQMRARREGESQEDYWERMRQPTGRAVWLDASDSECFESRTAPETAWMAAALPREQSGTYFRTERTQDGMTVWRWGRRDDTEVRASSVGSSL